MPYKTKSREPTGERGYGSGRRKRNPQGLESGNQDMGKEYGGEGEGVTDDCSILFGPIWIRKRRETSVLPSRSAACVFPWTT